ncbi:urease accessory protein UreF [Treponema ruminis]|uniref:Urease accessory protein UreF n=1 Tax=Treponema ruminis TaxID=744515 RepID=A0A7W8GB15_9SPIR|nr:urease accessory protein UreF [Treponema ruminis]MBB5227138.1 urease accessory protein [Treponema ruminis]
MSIDFFELLQLNDAAFPIGSYTHSWGLETFVQKGIIRDSESAESYFRAELESNFLTNDFLCVRLSYEAAEKSDWQELLEIDEIYNASRNAKEIREGSKKLAARFLKTVRLWKNLNGGEENEENPCAPKHFPPVYGSHCALSKISELEALKAFLYSQISARVVTAVKLVPLSQSEGQKILHSLFALFGEILEKVMQLSKEDLCRSSPQSEILSMQHEFLYTRLYMS